MALAAFLLGCRACQPRSEDCGEDLACFSAKMETCTEWASFTDGRLRTRWRIAGYAGPDCHLVAVSPGPTRREAHCLFPTEAARVWRDGGVHDPWSGGVEDDACYVGDGGCVGIPVLAPLCVLGDCVAGRWTYTCELTPGGHVEQCIGTKALDRTREPPDAACWLKCEHGTPKVACFSIRTDLDRRSQRTDGANVR